MDERAVEKALALDAQWVEALRRSWLAVIEASVWGDVRGARPGAAGRMRKRVLEMGEHLRSLTASRDWIPRPRERLKSALASALSVEETLAALEHDARVLKGADIGRLEPALAHLGQLLGQRLPALKARWAELLDAG